MRILFLPAYFLPEHGASSYLDQNIKERLANSGYQMLLYTPIPTRGISDDIAKEYKHKRIEWLYDKHLEVHRFWMFREGRRPLSRALRYALNWIKQFFIGIFAKDIDCIFLASTPPIQGVLGSLLKKIKKIPFIYNLQDIFPDSLVSTGMTKEGSLLWKVGRRIENFTYRHADVIVVISEDFKRNIMAKGVPEEKIEVIRNWVEEDAVVSIPRSENVLFPRYGLDPEKFYITYSGNIGMTQNLDMLLDVMEELQNEAPDVRLVLIGEGAYKPRAEEIIKEKNLSNVSMLPFQPYEEISHVFSLGDAGLVISKPGVGSNSVPSKTWSIMSASCPVLANFDENELKDIVSDHRCGIFTKAGDKEAFKAAILELYHHPEMCQEYGHNGRKYILDNLTKSVGTQQYVDVIKRFEKQ